VLEIHNSVIESTGGSYGVRDKNVLESALFSPLATSMVRNYILKSLRK